MGNLIDRAVIRTTLTAHPTIRSNLRALVRNITLDAFNDHELGAIEREVVESLKVSETLGMPSSGLVPGQALELTTRQLGVVQAVVSRFRNVALRSRLAGEIDSAVSAGRLKVK